MITDKQLLKWALGALAFSLLSLGAYEYSELIRPKTGTGQEVIFYQRTDPVSLLDKQKQENLDL